MTAGTDRPDENPEEPAAAKEYRSSIPLLVIVTALSAAADLGTKWWAKAMLSGADKTKPRQITVIPDHFDFIYTLNPGGAWSFLRGLPENLRRPFFLFVSSAAIIFIISVYRRLHPEQWAMRWGLSLALGGAIGNLVDRIRYGSVIDFIDWYGTYKGREVHWPTFNVADIAIVLGVLFMALDTFSSRKPRAHKETPPKEPGNNADLPGAETATPIGSVVIEPAGSVLEPVPKE
jgi:signal peptidase II